MANRTTIKDIPVSVGDIVRVNQISKEAGKERSSLFEGRVIAISGRSPNKSFTVRRIGIDNVGVEKIFPIASPTIAKIEVKKHLPVKRAKLFNIRDQK